MATIDKHSYAHMFGPIAGDRVRLAFAQALQGDL